MAFYNNPFFWALVSMFGLAGACSAAGTKKVGEHPLIGGCIVLVFVLGRIILVLPHCVQPRFEIAGLYTLLGLIIFVTGLVFMLPAFVIKPFNVARGDMELKTTGFYRLTRNPIYFGEVLWYLGWAIIHRSVIGISLVPLWWLGLLFLICIEEESLERELGQNYLEYKKRIRGRIIPGLPI